MFTLGTCGGGQVQRARHVALTTAIYGITIEVETPITNILNTPVPYLSLTNDPILHLNWQ